MYGKIFESMYDGTIAVNWKALITFQQMIILCDQDGHIDITPPSLARRTGIPLDIIEEGIEFLLKPDKYSRSEAEEGRRIIPLENHRDWGWKIVNHKQYRDLSTREEKREYDKKRYQSKKSGKVEKSENGSEKVEKGDISQHSADFTHADTDANTDEDIKNNNSSSLEIVKRVFEHWTKVMEHPRARLDDKRKKLIQRALKLGYTEVQLKTAIEGCKSTPWNMGENPDGTIYDSISLILRDAEHIDRFNRNYINPPSPKNKATQLSNQNQQAAESAFGKMK